MKKYDAIIIGGGQAANPLSQELAKKGWQVALVERKYLGGSCINYGCTPTKKMIASARVAYLARRAPEYGVQTGEVTVDLPKIVKMKDELVQSWRDRLVKRAEQNDHVTLIHGEACFSGPKQISVDNQELTAEHIFINTGSYPQIPPIDGLENVPYYTNLNILDLSEIPKHLLVIGGSYIGLEFGQMFRRFGSEVTVIEQSGQIVEHEDEDVSQTLRETLEKEGIKFLINARVKRAEKDGQGAIRLEVETSQSGVSQVDGSHLLLAAGRKPNTEELNLSAVGVETDQRGYIPVNDYLETNVPGIYALGDVKGGPAFTHISYNDYQIVFHNLFHEDKQSIKNRIIPYTLYTDPELGRVGMTEKEARKAGRNIKVGKIPLSYVARATERNETDGLMKVIVDADTDRILGAAILSVDGGELVQTLMVAMMAGAPWTMLKGAVYIHPTLTEGFFSLMDSVQ